jgi:outer membrane biosynthesis protein TonB
MLRVAAIVTVVIAAAVSGAALPARAALLDDKKPVKKPVVDLDSSAKKRRDGQVMPGDTAPPAPRAPAPAAAPKPAEPAKPAPQPAPTPAAAPAQPPSAPVPAPAPSPSPKPSTPPPAPTFHTAASAIARAPAGAQARKPGASDAGWTDISEQWTADGPVEVRVGMHAAVVLRINGATDPAGPVPSTLVTLWPLARAVIVPEFVDGRWVVGVRITRGQVTVQPESTADPDPEALTRWRAAVRTPERAVPISGAGGRVAYDTVRRTRVWALLSD